MGAKLLAVIDPQRCTGCGRCVAVCDPHVLHLQPLPGWRKVSVLADPAGCTGCRKCEQRCPFDAIHMSGRTPPGH